MKLLEKIRSTTKNTILVDVDGTLCTDTCWTIKECLKAKPRQDIIAKVNALYRNNRILIYTARNEEMMPATLEWLKKNGVMFHGWAVGKNAGDLYIDDRAVRPEEL